MTEQELDNIINEKAKAKELAVVEQSTQPPQERNIVKESEQQCLNDISQSEDFKKATTGLYEQKAKTQLTAEAIKIKSQELQNEYDTYALDKKKQLLDEQVKADKLLLKEQMKAEVMQKKIEIALKRYGYLTPLLNENGEIMRDEDGNILVDMSKFTPNKMSNRFKEFEHNWANMNKSARKIITTSIKTILILGAITLGCFILYKLGAWVLPVLGKLAP